MSHAASRSCIVAAILLFQLVAHARSSAEALPSWRAGPIKQSIVQFVENVSREGDVDYVPPAERIATFDNDGTLWSEKPTYFPVLFAIDRLRELAPSHPEWRTLQPFRKLLQDGNTSLDANEMREVENTAFLGMSPEEFSVLVTQWMGRAHHPSLQRTYADLTYVPMLELLAYLREHDFTIYICSGAETDFVRPVARDLYGVSPWQVIGSNMQMALQINTGVVRLERLADWLFPLSEGPGKALNIQRHIGQRPILAAGNSNGDIEMLQFVANPSRPSLALLVHHDDEGREFAYDEGAENALNLAARARWQVVSMKRDFARVFAADR